MRRLPAYCVHKGRNLEAVDGVDLGMMLAKWGSAPRNPVPPSDYPLGPIN